MPSYLKSNDERSRGMIPVIYARKIQIGRIYGSVKLASVLSPFISFFIFLSKSKKKCL